jgi:glutamyl-tRNA synthetase
MPDEGELTVHDRVQGAVTQKYAGLDDLILLRSDGNPTYLLAVVVDDHDMGVTHVIRGDDHLNNAFRQIPIIDGMGWERPVYAHVPLIHGPDGKKLSKRHGATGVDAYRDELGYLPEGLKNYLLRLGWSHGDDEIIPEEKAIEWFDLDGLNKAPARLDFKKLDATNGHYMAQADDERLYKLFLARPEAQKLSDAVKARIRAAMPALKTRSANFVVLADQAKFLGDIRPVALSGKAADLVNAEAKERLVALVKRWEALADWSEAAIKEDLAQFAAQTGIGLGKIGPVLRAVLTGGAPAPDIALVLALLGRNESLARIRDHAAGG